MNARTKGARVAFIVLVAALIAVAVYFGLAEEEGQLAVGGKDFDEQTIVGEMAAQLIEERMGVRVRRTFNLAGNLPSKLIRTGEIDIYLDYTGTGYMDILGIDYDGETPKEIYEHVRAVYPIRFGVEWLSPLGFNNTYTLTMRRKHAEELGIAKISDLARHTYLKAGFDPSFRDRADCYPGLKRRYGFEFDEVPAQLAIGIMYKACRDGEVDVIDAFATDGRIAKFDLKILVDDKQFFPPYDAAFNVRVATLKKFPTLRATLEMLAGKFTDTEMRTLNHAVSEGGRRGADVAREFLVKKGLLTAM
jgi:glycine betaine/choline ABC-type transport system substrate-binding protein